MDAKLFQLLTNEEITKLSSIKFYGAHIETNLKFKELTIEILSQLSWILIETEYKGQMPQGALSAIAIQILTNRAIERNIGLF